MCIKVCSDEQSASTVKCLTRHIQNCKQLAYKAVAALKKQALTSVVKPGVAMRMIHYDSSAIWGAITPGPQAGVPNPPGGVS